MKIYFDNAASTKILDIFHKDILEIYGFYGNPSSVHQEGKRSRFELEKTRQIISEALNINSRELIFTSGATESNNMIIKQIALSKPNSHIITTSIEHPSVLKVCRYLETQGCEVTYLKPNSKGYIEVENLEKNIKDNTVLVTIMGVNNETGVKQPLYEIGQILKDKDIYFHSDLTQYLLKEPIDIQNLNIDAFSASFHKIHGPKGVGLAYIKSSINVDKLIHGGGHERNRRAGTENLQGIILGGRVFKYMNEHLEENMEKMKKLNTRLVEGLKSFGDKIKINNDEHKVNNIINVQIKGEQIDYLLPLFDIRGVYLSGGSACQSGSISPSYVLREQGLSEQEARSSIRVSLSIDNTEEEVDYFLEVLKDIIGG